MNDVTLSPAMGAYLNMLNSNKPGTERSCADRQRELRARADAALHSGPRRCSTRTERCRLTPAANRFPPIAKSRCRPSRARTPGGHTPHPLAAARPNSPTKPRTTTMPMAAVESAHDTNAKILLGGITLPAGQTAEQDLAGALDRTSSTSPTSVPSSAANSSSTWYPAIQAPRTCRASAAVFANNGSDVRGDMKAVITAILIDPEARAGDTDPAAEAATSASPSSGITDVMRAPRFHPQRRNRRRMTSSPMPPQHLGNYTSALSRSPTLRPASSTSSRPIMSSPVDPRTRRSSAWRTQPASSCASRSPNTIVYNKISGFTVNLTATSPLGVMLA